MGVLRHAAPIALAALVSVVGCEPRVAEPPVSPPPPPPERIVVVSSSLAEIVFRLGEGGRVVGVGDFVRSPAAALELPRIGGLFDPRLEQIVALEPDLALLLPSEQELAGHLEGLEIEVLTVPSETLSDVEKAVASIGERLGAPERAAAIVADWRRGLAADPIAGEPRVILSLAREAGRLGQVLAAGPDTFFDELLDRMGAVNQVADAPMRYPQLGIEEIVQRQPQVIVELQPEALTDEEAERLTQEWSAVLGTRVCVRLVAGDYVLLPGPRLPQLYQELREAIASCVAGEETAAPGSP